MSTMRVPVTEAKGIECPRCSAVLSIDASSPQTTCSCGFRGSTVYILEADYLRSGLPGWQARLEGLDASIAAGSLPPAGYIPMNQALDMRRRPVAISPALAEPAHRRGPAAYEVMLAVGSFLLVAGIAAYTVIAGDAFGLATQSAILAALIVVTAAAAVMLETRMVATSTAMAVAAAGSWIFSVAWLPSSVGERSWWYANHWFGTTALAATAIVWTAAGRYFKAPTWTYVGTVAGAATPAAALLWASAAVQDATTFSRPVILAVAAMPLTIAGILLLQKQLTIFDDTRGATVLAGWASIACSLWFLLDSQVFAGTPWTTGNQNAAWFLHIALAAWLLSTVAVSEFATPVIGGVALGMIGGFTFLTSWVALGVFCVLILAATSWRKTVFSNITTPIIALAVMLFETSKWYSVGAAELGNENTFQGKLEWHTAIELGVVALACLYIAAADSQLFALLPAWVFGAIAIGQFMAIIDYNDIVEKVSLPIAGYTLILGLAAWWRRRDLSTGVWLAPALMIGLIPSAFQALGEAPTARFYVVLGVAVVMLVAGVFTNMLATLLTGTVAAILLAIQPLTDPGHSIPMWVSFVAAGALLVFVGAMFERLRRQAGSQQRLATTLR